MCACEYTGDVLFNSFSSSAYSFKTFPLSASLSHERNRVNSYHISQKTGQGNHNTKTAILDSQRDFQTGSGAHPAFYPRGTKSLPGRECGVEREADRASSFSAGVKSVWRGAILYSLSLSLFLV